MGILGYSQGAAFAPKRDRFNVFADAARETPVCDRHPVMARFKMSPNL